MSPTKKLGRCPKGTRRNKKTGLCEAIEGKQPIPIDNDLVKSIENEVVKSIADNVVVKSIDENGVIENTVPVNKTRRRCPTGYRKNPKTGECDPLKPKIKIISEPVIPETQPPYVVEPAIQQVAVVQPKMEAATQGEIKMEDLYSRETNASLFTNEKREHDATNTTIRPESVFTSEYDFLYPTLNDPLFNVKIAERKEFGDTQYDGDISTGIREKANIMCNAKFELMPHQLFVRNFMSFQTPYNGLLLYHGLGSGKTCSAIGIAEEMRGYMKQVGIKQRILVVASPNVQGNFRLQLFDERKLKKIPNPNQTHGIMGTEEDIWDLHSCVGNSLLKEINPANVKGLSREKVISQINTIINTYYKFMGYGQFTNYMQEKISISSPERFTEKERAEYEIRNIRRVFNNRLIIIDEVHNIRMTDENSNKKTAVLLMKVAKYSENMRLLLLSATPMFNSHKEIIWLTNLLNINDKRATIEASSVFDKNGNYREPDEKGLVEGGEQLLKRKLTGYVSYVRGENPFIFPYRIYPHLFSPEHTFSAIKEKEESSPVYPKRQMNNMEITDPIQYVKVYLNSCGTYQERVYNAMIENMRNREYIYQTAMGNIRELPSFENMESFGYTLLQAPLEALNMVYPTPEVDSMLETETIMTGHSTTIGESIGNQGLLNTMIFDDNTKPTMIKHNFRYKDATLEKYGAIFSPENVGLYSAKIAKICDILKKSKGIVVIYSQYIHGGMIPIALALEEMGFSRYCSTSTHNKNLFQKPPTAPIDATTMLPMDQMESTYAFSPAKYMMISGDKSYSPSNTEDIKYATSPANKNGEKVKVIIVSKAGSEGLDFKNVRQVHILEPWYNMNRIEQIIGRGVRNLSHCDLPFEERNVEIYMHASLLSTNREEEAVDLYVYRFAEKKAIQIGKVSRTLKESSVDCILNIAQTNFTVDKLGAIAENENITMNLSSGKTIQFRVGDEPYSALCDYMETCEYKCTPTISDPTASVGKRLDTYNKYYAKTNNDYIVKRIAALYREKAFYKRDELIREINRVKIYPVEQIYYALTLLVKGSNEYLVDKYGRIGNLLNKGEYYVFQPVEISDPNISIYERSVPVDYKRRDIVLEVATDFDKQKTDTLAPEKTYETLITKMITNYKTAFSPTQIKIGSGEKNWYKHANHVLDSIQDEYSIPRERIEEYVIYHMLDLLMIDDKIVLLNHVLSAEQDPPSFVEDKYTYDKLIYVCKKYFNKKIVERDGNTVAFLTTRENVSKLYVKIDRSVLVKDADATEQNGWVELDSEDAKTYTDLIARNVVQRNNVNDSIIGFVNVFKDKEMVFKIKDVRQKRNNVGARCGDSTSKSDVVKLLNTLNGTEETYENTFHIGLCVLMEVLLRWYSDTQRNGKVYFFDAEQTYVNNIVKGK